MAGLRVREGGDKESPRPFEELNPFLNGGLGKPLPLLFVAHQFFFFLTSIVSDECFQHLYGKILQCLATLAQPLGSHEGGGL